MWIDCPCIANRNGLRAVSIVIHGTLEKHMSFPDFVKGTAVRMIGGPYIVVQRQG
jgi:hypothetical protein